MERMRPMDSAPRVGTKVHLWWRDIDLEPEVVIWHDGWLERAASFAGWTPIVRPLEPEAPEPEAQTMPPSMERATIQLFSAAQESVALRQPLAAFQALAGVAHAQATRRAALFGRKKHKRGIKCG